MPQVDPRGGGPLPFDVHGLLNLLPNVFYHFPLIKDHLNLLENLLNFMSERFMENPDWWSDSKQRVVKGCVKVMSLWESKYMMEREQDVHLNANNRFWKHTLATIQAVLLLDLLLGWDNFDNALTHPAPAHSLIGKALLLDDVCHIYEDANDLTCPLSILLWANKVTNFRNLAIGMFFPPLPESLKETNNPSDIACNTIPLQMI